MHLQRAANVFSAVFDASGVRRGHYSQTHIDMIKSKSAVGMLLGTLYITSRSVMTVVIVKSRGGCLETPFLVIWSWYIQ